MLPTWMAPELPREQRAVQKQSESAASATVDLLSSAACSPRLCAQRQRLWGIHSPFYHTKELPVFHSATRLPLHFVLWAAKALVQETLKASFPVAAWAGWLPRPAEKGIACSRLEAGSSDK